MREIINPAHIHAHFEFKICRIAQQRGGAQQLLRRNLVSQFTDVICDAGQFAGKAAVIA